MTALELFIAAWIAAILTSYVASLVDLFRWSRGKPPVFRRR